MKEDKKDLGYTDDAVDLISDLACAETHLARTWNLTKDDNFLELMIMARRDRSELLYSLVDEDLGEAYCTCKHLSKVARNWEELANRLTETGNIELAKEYIKKSVMYKKCVLFIFSMKGGKDESVSKKTNKSAKTE